MKRRFVALTAFLLPVLLQAQVDSAYQAKAGLADVADEDPGLFLVMMFILLGFVAIIITLTILLLSVVAITGFLIFCGVLSVSVINGLHHRSFTKGAVLFMNISMALAGSVVGITTSLILKAFFHFNLSPAYTSLAGLLAGGIIGWVIAKTMLKAGRMLLQKMVTA